MTGWWIGSGSYVIWLLSDVGLKDWISVVIVPMHKGTGERTECTKNRAISLLSVVAKIYMGILIEFVE